MAPDIALPYALPRNLTLRISFFLNAHCILVVKSSLYYITERLLQKFRFRLYLETIDLYSGVMSTVTQRYTKTGPEEEAATAGSLGVYA